MVLYSQARVCTYALPWNYICTPLGLTECYFKGSRSNQGRKIKLFLHVLSLVYDIVYDIFIVITAETALIIIPHFIRLLVVLTSPCFGSRSPHSTQHLRWPSPICPLSSSRPVLASNTKQSARDWEQKWTSIKQRRVWLDWKSRAVKNPDVSPRTHVPCTSWR